MEAESRFGSSYPFQKQGAVIASLDFNDRLRLAYDDCIIACNNLEIEATTESHAGATMGITMNRVSYGRFNACVKILAALIPEDMRDATYKEKGIPVEERMREQSVNGYDSKDLFADHLNLFHELGELFNRKGLWRQQSAKMGHV